MNCEILLARLNTEVDLGSNQTQKKVLTIQPRSNSNQNDWYTPVPQEWAESRSIAIPDLLEGQLVSN